MSRHLAAAFGLVAIAALTVSAPALATRLPCEPLSLRERAAQTVMTGIPSTSATGATVRLVERHAGSVVLLGRNIDDAQQLRTLLRRLRSAAPFRLLVAVDEEGGRVSRLGENGLVDRLPSARTLGAEKSPAQLRRIGERLGRQIADLGIDWNLAPVLDVADAGRNTVIGDRSYSGDARVAAAAGAAFAEGLATGGVLTTGKHFPGHGRTTVDSHDRMPTVTASRRALWRRDIRPFRAALPSLDAVMTAHVRYTALDERRPASLSPAVHRLLRRDLAYRGLVVTDALEMGAIARRRTVPEAAEQALRAGADVALIGDWTATADATTRIVDAVRRGRLSRARVEQAAGRVLTAKGYSAAEVGCLLG
jgi:beta-N-acetylhexosaminidase